MSRYLIFAVWFLGMTANAQCFSDNVMDGFRDGIVYFENSAEAHRYRVLERELRRDAYMDGTLAGSGQYLEADIVSFSINVDVADKLKGILEELIGTLDASGESRLREGIRQALGLGLECPIDIADYNERINVVFSDAESEVVEFQSANNENLENLALRDYSSAISTIVRGLTTSGLVSGSLGRLERAEQQFRETEQDLRERSAEFRARREELLEEEREIARREEAARVCPWPIDTPSFATGPIYEVQLCLDAGVDPNVASEYFLSPLHVAARDNDDPAVIMALLEAGANPNAPMGALDRSGHHDMTPLFFAAFGNPNAAVILALVNGGADVNARDSREDTALWHAAQENDNPAVIDALIEAGADPNAQNIHGSSPLERAAASGNYSVAEALLRGGAEPNLRDNNGDLPLHYAVLNAARSGKIEIVRTLIEGGANPNARDAGGQTALHVAMRLDASEVVDILLAGGADPTLRDVSGNTPADVR